MKILKAVGITGGTVEMLRQCNPKDFSDDHYEGRALYWSQTNKPVVVLLSKSADVPVWKVLCGTSEFYFRKYGEVVEFCNKRGYRHLSRNGSQKE